MEIRNAPASNHVDRISSLPDSLIHHVFSFLDMRFVVQTCVLSKRWRHMWSSLPTLNFDSDVFVRPRLGPTQDWVKFAEFVDWVLLTRETTSDIQRFRLVFLVDEDCIERDMLLRNLLKWISAVVVRNVQELSIKIGMCLIFFLPHCLMNCKSLMKLELTEGDDRYTQIMLPNSVYLPQIKSIILNSYITTASVGKLISSCPVLETFIACKVNGNTNVRDIMINSSSLKHLDIKSRSFSNGNNLIIKLNTPNLTSFVCQDDMGNDYSLEELPSLVTADIEMFVHPNFDGDHIIEFPEAYMELIEEHRVVFAKRMLKFLRAFHGVKELKLSHGFFEVLSGSSSLLENPPCQLYNLRCLKMEFWLTRGCLHVITYLLKISPNIESIYITSKECKLANFKGVCEPGLSQPCILAHLKLIEIREVQGYDNELKLLEILLKNATALEDVTLYFRHNPCSTDQIRKGKVSEFSKKLKALPRASSSINTSFFYRC